MLLVLAILAAVTGALIVVARQLHKAPVGYEDEQGFHIVHRVRGSAIRRHPKPGEVTAGSLKSARAHS